MFLNHCVERRLREEEHQNMCCYGADDGIMNNKVIFILMMINCQILIKYYSILASKK